MKINKLEKKKEEIKRTIDKIAPEKLDRTLFLLEYMVKVSTEEGKALTEYSKRDDVTLDMMVAWVKNRQTPSLVEVAI